MHARYYSFHTARFLSVDPVKGEVGGSQSWNRYAYVMGNPVAFLDPTGAVLEVHIGDIDDRHDLLAQWENQTGLDLDLDDGKLLIIGVKTDADGNILGSEKARSLIRARVNSGEVFKVFGVSNEPDIPRGEKRGNTILIDFGDHAASTYVGIPKATANAAMTSYHEFYHQDGFSDPPDSERGGTVGQVNQIRQQLGLPIRDQYGPLQDDTGREYLPFGNGTGRLYLPMHVFTDEVAATIHGGG